MGAIYFILEIIIYAVIILFVGFYVAYIIDRSHEDVNRIIIARRSILKDLTRVAELVEENNRILARIIEHKKEDIKRRYEDVRKY